MAYIFYTFGGKIGVVSNHYVYTINPNVRVIATGQNNSLAIDKNGKAWSWGYNNYGQLGDNSIIDKVTPVAVLGTTKTFCQIGTGAGATHTISIDKNGKVWGWGYNNNGQLGNNSTTSTRTPVSILGASKTFCQIAAGQYHTIGIDKNGKVWCWGYNGYGQLGINSVTSARTPVAVLGATKTFCQIACEYFSTMAIDKNGQVWGWGYNKYGALGNNSTVSQRTPVVILGATKTFCQIVGSRFNALAIDKNGQVWGWGYNGYGQLGDNSITNQSTPIAVLGTTKTFCQIAAGYEYSIGLDKNGKVWGWGNNGSGQIGDNTTVSKCTPVAVLGTAKTFCKISAGGKHSLAIDYMGRVWGWGYDNYGQVGDNRISSKKTPVTILGATKTFCIAVGGAYYIIGLDKNGQVWGWGYNDVGRLGNNSTIDVKTPVSILGVPKTFCKISAGTGLTLAIDKNGKVWSWGSNNQGGLGDNTTTNQSTPIAVLGAAKTFCNIIGSNMYSIALDYNGKAWSWGYNNNGQLGNNSTTTKKTPVAVLGAAKTFCQISSSNYHVLAIDKNGKLWGWGYNYYGQLGNKLNSFGGNRSTPVAVLGATKTFCQIGTGYNFSLGLDKNGKVWGWGYNGQGQLGDNSTTSHITPIAVLGSTKTFCKISGGQQHSVAIDKNGKAWTWGQNNNGQLGNNDTVSQRTPVAVYGNGTKTFCSIFAGPGAYQTVAIDKNGKVWCWGANNKGQLGINNPNNTNTPIMITTI